MLASRHIVCDNKGSLFLQAFRTTIWQCCGKVIYFNIIKYLNFILRCQNRDEYLIKIPSITFRAILTPLYFFHNNVVIIAKKDL